MAELDALELDVEEEGPSYLADLNKAPDFIDEPPVEVAEVLRSCIPALGHALMSLAGRAQGSCQDHSMRA